MTGDRGRVGGRIDGAQRQNGGDCSPLRGGLLPGGGGLLLARPIAFGRARSGLGWPSRRMQQRDPLPGAPWAAEDGGTGAWGTRGEVPAPVTEGICSRHRGDLLPVFVRGGDTVPDVSTGTTLRRQEFSDSLIERSLGRFGGWQMVPGREPRAEIEIRSATGALVSRARGAPLVVEADVLTWLLAQWVQAGCPRTAGFKRRSISSRALCTGRARKRTEDRRAVASRC